MTFADNQTGMTSINSINKQQQIAASDNHTYSNTNSDSKTDNTIVAITLADMLQQPMLVGLVGQVFLSLGSNHHPKQHLAYAREVLSELGQMRCSPELVNPDFTATKAQPKPDYTNQCLLLSLSAAVSTAKFVAMMAQIEADCQRQRQSSSLAMVSESKVSKSNVSKATVSKSNVSKAALSSNNGSNLASAQQDSLKQANADADASANALKLVTLDIDILAIQPVQQNIWYRLTERYPFKAHELYGIHALKMAQKLL